MDILGVREARKMFWWCSGNGYRETGPLFMDSTVYNFVFTLKHFSCMYPIQQSICIYRITIQSLNNVHTQCHARCFAQL